MTKREAISWGESFSCRYWPIISAIASFPKTSYNPSDATTKPTEEGFTSYVTISGSIITSLSFFNSKSPAPRDIANPPLFLESYTLSGPLRPKKFPCLTIPPLASILSLSEAVPGLWSTERILDENSKSLHLIRILRESPLFATHNLIGISSTICIMAKTTVLPSSRSFLCFFSNSSSVLRRLASIAAGMSPGKDSSAIIFL
mmetsp:Transcript_21352/g.27110  ORF Transcript_21352/g.27110 Transcript_21352/m.27110 type:complete len:202 (-) Transcript_21352:187-792(-)